MWPIMSIKKQYPQAVLEGREHGGYSRALLLSSRYVTLAPVIIRVHARRSVIGTSAVNTDARVIELDAGCACRGRYTNNRNHEQRQRCKGGFHWCLLLSNIV